MSKQFDLEVRIRDLVHGLCKEFSTAMLENVSEGEIGPREYDLAITVLQKSLVMEAIAIASRHYHQDDEQLVATARRLREELLPELLELIGSGVREIHEEVGHA